MQNFVFPPVVTVSQDFLLASFSPPLLPDLWRRQLLVWFLQPDVSQPEGSCFTKQGFHILVCTLLLLFSSHVVNGNCPALFCCICQVLLGTKRRVTLSCYQILIEQGTEGLLGKTKFKVWERKSKPISLEYFNSIFAFFFNWRYVHICVYTHMHTHSMYACYT